MPETMKLLESTKSKITKNKNGENIRHLEITEVVLVQCNIVNNNHKQKSRVLNKFVSNKPLGQLFNISPKKLLFSKTLNPEFSYIEVWSTDQGFKPLQIEYKINITLVIS